MRLIFLFIGLLFITLFFINLYLFRRRSITILNFTIWSVCLLALIVLSFTPSLITYLAATIGMTERANFVFTVSISFLFAFMFSQLNFNSRLRENLVIANQLISIANYNSYCNKNETTAGKKILVKIAAYNEAENIAGVLKRMPPDVNVLVIDDASMDNTADIAANHGASVVRHIKNMGQGIGDITGFLIALKQDYNYIIEMDGDGQHDPREIPLFVKALDENPDIDIITGSRILGSANGNACTIRKRFLPFYTKIINLATGFHLTDGLCGFKAYRVNSLRKHPKIFDNIVEREYIAAELYIRFARSDLKVSEVPVNIADRIHGRSHKGTFRYGFAVLWIILRTLLSKR